MAAVNGGEAVAGMEVGLLAGEPLETGVDVKAEWETYAGRLLA